MTHISHKKLEAKIDKELKELMLFCLKNLDRAKIKKVLNTILTKTEIIMIKKRIGVLFLLQENMPLENIAKITKTTRQTVYRIKLQLHEVANEDKKFFISQLKSWEIKDLVKGILNIKLPSKQIFRKRQLD